MLLVSRRRKAMTEKHETTRSSPLTLLNRFRTSNKGSIGVIFGLSLIPMFFMVGAAVDLSRTLRIRTVLNAAADSAALSSVSRQSNPT